MIMPARAASATAKTAERMCFCKVSSWIWIGCLGGESQVAERFPRRADTEAIPKTELNLREPT
jgi:hypothetical protein